MNNGYNKQGGKIANFISFLLTLILMIIAPPLVILAFLIDYFQRKRDNRQSDQLNYDFDTIDIYSYLENHSVHARI